MLTRRNGGSSFSPAPVPLFFAVWRSPFSSFWLPIGVEIFRSRLNFFFSEMFPPDSPPPPSAGLENLLDTIWLDIAACAFFFRSTQEFSFFQDRTICSELPTITRAGHQPFFVPPCTSAQKPSFSVPALAFQIFPNVGLIAPRPPSLGHFLTVIFTRLVESGRRLRFFFSGAA